MKKSFFTKLAVLGIVCFSTSMSYAQTIWRETFESYVDLAAFETVWTAYGTQVGNYTFGAAGAWEGVKGVTYPENNTLQIHRKRTITSTIPTDATPLVVDFWIRNKGASNGRYIIAVGPGTGAPLAAIGVSNNVTNAGWFGWLGASTSIYTPDGGTPSVADTAYKVIGGTRGTDWKHLTMVIKVKSVDMYEGGILLGNLSRSAAAANFGAITTVSFGGGLSSGNPITSVAGFDIDDIHVYSGALQTSVQDWNLY